MLVAVAFLLDVGTLLLLAHYAGFLVAALVAISSSLVGLCLCVWSNRRLRSHFDMVTQESFGGLPDEYKSLQQFEAAASCTIMLLFISPGFLSDLLALVMLLPRLRKDHVLNLRRSLAVEAARQGKTLEELCKIKACKPRK